MIVFEDKKSASTSDLLRPPVPSPSLGGLTLHNLPSESNIPDQSTSTTRRTTLLPPPYANASRSSSNAASTSFSVSSLSLPSTSSGLTSPFTGIQLPQRSNNLYITRPLGHIKGSWIIDTSLRLPAAMLPAVEEGTTRKNLQFLAKMGKISARVEVKGRLMTRRPQSPESASTSSSVEDGRANLVFRSETSSIKLRLVSRKFRSLS